MENCYRVGLGFDIHKFGKGRPLMIGGIKIPCEYGLVGFSDADVLIHSLCDAILGAMGDSDIGSHFPNSNICYKNKESEFFLKEIKKDLDEEGFKISNIDIVILADVPKISDYREKMKENIARILLINNSQISIKATTTEGLGLISNKKGIASWSIVSLFKN